MNKTNIPSFVTWISLNNGFFNVLAIELSSLSKIKSENVIVSFQLSSTFVVFVSNGVCPSDVSPVVGSISDKLYFFRVYDILPSSDIGTSSIV